VTITNAQRLGKLLFTARQEKGLSTTQLAELAATNQSTIVRLEKGEFAQPSPQLLQRLAHQLDLPLPELYRLAGVPLPALQPYLRAQVGLSEKDTARVQAYIAKLAAKYGGDGTGPSEGADELPEP
jgi:transcriptional regulator with XRE-family HTH domain